MIKDLNMSAPGFILKININKYLKVTIQVCCLANDINNCFMSLLRMQESPNIYNKIPVYTGLWCHSLVVNDIPE